MISANEYFDGNVKSLGYETEEGKSTIGVMEPGEYEFNTADHEVMVVIEGELHVKLPDSEEYEFFKGGDVFEVEAGKSFQVRSIGQTSYICQYR